MEQHKQPYFHYQLLKYLTLYSSDEELKEIAKNNQVLHLEIDNGVYTINYNDLVEKASNEANQLVVKTNVGVNLSELLNKQNNGK